jgi:hypothetical protein
MVADGRNGTVGVRRVGAFWRFAGILGGVRYASEIPAFADADVVAVHLRRLVDAKDASASL